MSTNHQTSVRAIDEPLREPEGDLLDMDRHAKALADFIKQDRKLPFTVGIFGEWGEGKTTMVNFVQRHLTPPPPMTDEDPPQPAEGPPSPFYFVEFSAWPYTTSEKLWRALILKIAKVLYEGPKETKKKDETDKSDSDDVRPDLFAKLSAFLHGDLFRKETRPREVSRYEQLKAKLDRTDYGKISKRTPNEGLDDQAVLSAVVSGALSVLGTVSPLAAGIRTFIGGETKLNSEKSSDATGDKKPTEQFDALTTFQTHFQNLIESRGGKAPVYVFIDDLDRAQPDVALDIMESIRIALSDCDCVYILAVDERLIAQGLRLRYRELFEKQAELEIASKGQEYLEKIIQFRTRVPPRTEEQTQRLIAAEFPHWTPAGDIIQSIVGNNPRRVKQYCQRLSFQNMIGSPFTVPSTFEEEETAPAQTAQTQSNISEALALTRLIRPPNFNEFEIPDLFVLLNEAYGQYPGTPFERASAMIKKYDDTGRLNDVKKAVESLKPGLLAHSSIRPAE